MMFLRHDGAAQPRSRAMVLTILLLAVVAFLLRGRYFGNPDVHVDEQFYLLVGDRLLHDGAIPYVDIWDRKPVGLFLLYAAMRLLGGGGIVEYQLVATLFATATAALIALWPARIIGRLPGLLAGLFYLVFIHKFSGFGGEAEVFLNFFTTASAFVIAYRLSSRAIGDGTGLLGCGILSMALAGLALQIKPTSVFPGVFLGLTLLWLGYRAGWRWSRLAAAAVLWIFIALLPTLLVVGWYVQAGYFNDFLFANIWSIGLRQSENLVVFLERFRSQALSVGLPIAGGLLLLKFIPAIERSQGRTDLAFLLGWLAAGAVAFLSVGTFYANYALVITPMICVLLAVVARPKAFGWLAIGGMVVLGGYILAADQQRVAAQQAAAPSIYRMADSIRAHLHGRCLYVHRGLPIFYYLTDACISTRFAFPDHMSLKSEAPALGIDPVVEAERIIRSKPGVIVFSETDSPLANPETDAVVRQAIAHDYRLIASADGGRFQAYALR